MNSISTSVCVLACALALAACSSATEPHAESSAEQAAKIRPITVFQCETTQPLRGDVHTFSLEVSSFDDPAHLQLNGSTEDWENDENYPIVTAPNDLLVGLIDNYSISKKNGRFEVHGDSDGFQYTDLVLYENSDYTRGFVRVRENVNPQRGPIDYAPISCESSSKRPEFQINDDNLLGTYSGDVSDYCPGGFDSCTDAELKRKVDGSLELVLGGGPYWDGKHADVWKQGKVLLFSTKDRYAPGARDWDDCDDPGCGNVVQITGVIYPKKVDGGWAPTIKAYHTVEFDHPVEVDDPDGELRWMNRMTQDSAR